MQPCITSADWDELKEIHQEAAVFTLKEEDLSSDQTDTASEDESDTDELPEPLTHHFDISNLDLNKEGLLEKGQELATKLPMEYLPAALLALERATRGQSESPAWKEHRAGRITASRAKKLYILCSSTDPTRLIGEIMGYSGAPPATLH